MPSSRAGPARGSPHCSYIAAFIVHKTFFPGFLILLTVLALNVLSEGISDAWAAPAARRAAVAGGFKRTNS